MMFTISEGALEIRILTDRQRRSVSYLALVDSAGTVGTVSFKASREEWRKAYSRIRSIRRRQAN